MSNDKIDDGGAALPGKYLQGHKDGAGVWKDEHGWTWEPGLSKREHYACAAMAGILSHPDFPNDPRELSRMAVQNADALIAALKK